MKCIKIFIGNYKLVISSALVVPVLKEEILFRPQNETKNCCIQPDNHFNLDKYHLLGKILIVRSFNFCFEGFLSTRTRLNCYLEIFNFNRREEAVCFQIQCKITETNFHSCLRKTQNNDPKQNCNEFLTGSDCDVNYRSHGLSGHSQNKSQSHLNFVSGDLWTRVCTLNDRYLTPLRNHRTRGNGITRKSNCRWNFSKLF